MDLSSIYDIQVLDKAQQKISLNLYRGKVLLIVNVASQCGFTAQYEGLQQLYSQFSAKGFEVLAFPCNQFGGQEPGSDDEIQAFCSTRFNVTFPVFSKIDVNGSNASELFQYLKQQQSGVLGSKRIKWNFTKFLVDARGSIIARFPPSTAPVKLESIIQGLLSEDHDS